MKSIEVGDTVRIAVKNHGASHVGRIGSVVGVTPTGVMVDLNTCALHDPRWFARSDVLPLRRNFEVRKVEDSWWVASRSTTTGALSVEGAFMTHAFAMDYARSLAISINGWAK